MNPTIFLSHSSIDSVFVNRLANDIDAHGIRVWVDRAEIKVGDSLIAKIRDGIDQFQFLAAVISPDSVKSEWVAKEIDVAMNQEIAGKRVKVLPIMYRPCELPGFMLGKKYADFSDESKYANGLEDLVTSVGVVFNSKVLDKTITSATLGLALDKGHVSGTPMMVAPFHRPTQYLGQKISELIPRIGGAINAGGNLILESDKCYMFLEAEGDFVNYGEVQIKGMKPGVQTEAFDPDLILGAFSISPSELELVRSKIHSHVYYDHKRKLKITVTCLADGEPISLTFGSKYYGH